MRLTTKLRMIEKKIKTKRDLVSEFWELIEANFPSNDYNTEIYFDLDKQEFLVKNHFGNTRYEFKNHVVLIDRYDNNWLGNSHFDVNDITTDEEWKELQEKYGDDADYTDEKQLSSIGVSFEKRLVELFQYYEDDTHDYEQEIEEFKEELYNEK